MIAVDTGVLVHAHRADSPAHAHAARCLADLAESTAAWAIPWHCLHEFFAIVTNAHAFVVPTPRAVALATVEAWLAAPHLHLLHETGKHWESLRRLLIDGKVAGPAVQDARIAAVCLQHGVRELWSTDRDLRRFPALTVRNPLLRVTAGLDSGDRPAATVSNSAFDTADPSTRIRPTEVALLASVFVVAACGLVYELAAGALASYLLGDSVLQFSTVIGTYLFAMGLGSYLSRFLERQLVAHFLRIELMVGVVGGLMPAALFALFNVAAGSFRFALYGLVLAVGTLVGLEIPLVMRILKRHFSARYALKDLVSQVLTFDYLGALAVSVAFPLLLVPQLGLIRTGAFFGLLNAGVAVWALWLFRGELRGLAAHGVACALTVAALLAAFAGANVVTTWAEDRFYAESVLYSETSAYQRVVVTSGKAGVRLFLNGNLQFHSRDEYRYHEALVHPAMAAQGAPKQVLVLGGGDGMAVREVLKHASVEAVTLVELDPHMTTLFSEQPLLRKLNADALHSPKLKIVNADAFAWLEQHEGMYDVIVIDFPDPTNFAIGKLYTSSFYRLIDHHLAAGGYAVVQTTSPLIARKSFWTVVQTIEAAGLSTTPYHVHVPSFGEWGFILACRRPYAMPTSPSSLPPGLRFLDIAGLPALFQFPPDMARVPAEVNRLSNQVLVQTYEQEWGKVHW